MATETFTNNSIFTGDMLGETGLTADTNIVETTVITGITATKAANKDYWINGPLTYTITLANDSGEEFENVVFTDQLDPLIVLDQANGVTLNGASATYTYAGNLLTVNVGTIGPAGATLSFRVLLA